MNNDGVVSVVVDDSGNANAAVVMGVVTVSCAVAACVVAAFGKDAVAVVVVTVSCIVAACVGAAFGKDAALSSLYSLRAP